MEEGNAQNDVDLNENAYPGGAAADSSVRYAYLLHVLLSLLCLGSVWHQGVRPWSFNRKD